MPDFDGEDGFYLTEGLLQIWWNPKLSDHKDFHADPPVFIQSYHDWMSLHPEIEYYPTPVVGPPMWKFPSSERREEFKETFLETKERLREIMDEGIAAKRVEQAAEWYRQGKPRNEKGRAYIEKKMTEFYDQPESEAKLVKILVFPDPETGENIF